jgi:aminoglycoside phosphotransferase (APT) family kinase protein
MAALGRLLGSGNRAEVFEHGFDVIKLYRPGESRAAADREAAILAVVEPLGLPVPAVMGVEQVDGRWGLVMTRATGAPWADAASGAEALYLEAMAALHARIHRRPAAPLVSQKRKLASNIERGPMLGAAQKRRLLDALAALPDGDRLCHGDFHPYNILGAIERPTVIDWLDATSGHPAADVCRSFVLMSRAVPAFAAAYVETYARATDVSGTEIQAWTPCIAAARLSENVPAETDHLMALADGV